MSKEEYLFIAIGQKMQDAEQSQMFGKPCFKIDGKAFICFFQNEMVFKLPDGVHQEAMRLEGSKLFDPSGKGRAMKEWVQIPFTYSENWQQFATAAMKYVKEAVC